MSNAENLREFQVNLAEFVKDEVPESVRNIRDAASLEAVRSVVYLTPVDTGRLRGNWQTTIGRPAEGERDTLDPNGQVTVEIGQLTISEARDPYDPIWLHNGVPYGVYINDGTPKIVAFHMVEQTVDKLERRFG